MVDEGGEVGDGEAVVVIEVGDGEVGGEVAQQAVGDGDGIGNGCGVVTVDVTVGDNEGEAAPIVVEAIVVQTGSGSLDGDKDNGFFFTAQKTSHEN